MPIIRNEDRADADAIRRVNELAFKQPDEADLVDSLRKAGKAAVSLVAEENRAVVGHILFSPARIDGSDIPVAALAPMAVLPRFQRYGIGSLLVQEGIALCKEKGFHAIIVLGHPAYYPRFGFRPASEFGLTSQWGGIPDNAFMALELEPGALAGIGGVARYAAEFDQGR